MRNPTSPTRVVMNAFLAATLGMSVTALGMLTFAYLVRRHAGLGIEPVLLVMGLGQGAAMP